MRTKKREHKSIAKTEKNAIKKPREPTVNITIFSNAGDREKNENTGERETEEKIESHTEIHKEITRRAWEKKGSTHTYKD